MFQIRFKQSKTAFCLKILRNTKKLKLNQKKKKRNKKKKHGQKTGKLEKLLKRQKRQPVMVKELAFFQIKIMNSSNIRLTISMSSEYGQHKCMDKKPTAWKELR